MLLIPYAFNISPFRRRPLNWYSCTILQHAASRHDSASYFEAPSAKTSLVAGWHCLFSLRVLVHRPRMLQLDASHVAINSFTTSVVIETRGYVHHLTLFVVFRPFSLST